MSLPQKLQSALFSFLSELWMYFLFLLYKKSTWWYSILPYFHIIPEILRSSAAYWSFKMQTKGHALCAAVFNPTSRRAQFFRDPNSRRLFVRGTSHLTLPCTTMWTSTDTHLLYWSKWIFFHHLSLFVSRLGPALGSVANVWCGEEKENISAWKYRN